MAAAAAAAVIGAGASPALAQAAPANSSEAQIQALAARLDALEHQNSDLKRQLQTLQAAPAAPAAPPLTVKTAEAAPPAHKDGAAVQVSLANGRPSFATADGRFTAAFRGVLQLDAATFDQRAPGPLATDFRRGSLGDATEADHARDLSDGTNFRRVRIGVEGKAFGDWSYSFLYDFGGSGVEGGGVINQAWLQYGGLKSAKFRVGAFAPPASMDDVTSTNGSPFMERAAISEVVRGLAGADGRVGAGVLSNGARWNVSAVVTGATVGQSGYDEQLGFVGRAAFTPVKGADYLVHLGVNTSQVIHPPKGGADVAPGVASNVRLRERPESRVDGTRLVDTGAIDAKHVSAYGVEAAAQYKAWHVQSEYSRIAVDRRTGALGNPHFSGWYVQGAWTITGQPRQYSAASGAFDAPKVDKPFDPHAGRWGVWEVAARYSDLNLNDDAGQAGTAAAPDAVRGGDQRIATLGLNWYPNNAVRFQLNAQRVKVDRLSPGQNAFGAGALTPPAGAQVGQSFNLLAVRAQYAF